MLPTIKLIALMLCIFLIGGFIGYAVGFSLGVKTTIKEGLKVAKYFVNVSIDEELVRKAIFQYNNQIGGFIPNALIPSN